MAYETKEKIAFSGRVHRLRPPFKIPIELAAIKRKKIVNDGPGNLLFIDVKNIILKSGQTHDTENHIIEIGTDSEAAFKILNVRRDWGKVKITWVLCEKCNKKAKKVGENKPVCPRCDKEEFRRIFKKLIPDEGFKKSWGEIYE